MTITAKLRHETHLDHEMREYYAARDKKAMLDAQGRHRSEWCYAAYDGRLESPNEKVETSWDILLDRYSRRKT